MPEPSLDRQRGRAVSDATEPLTVTAPTPHEIVLTRAFAHPRRRVFAALTQPDLLVRWHGAQGWHLVVCEVDLRPGGAWRFVSEGPGGETMGMSGEYLVVEPPGRLVHTEAFDGSDEGHAVVTTDLAERDGRTTMTTTVRYASQRQRDAMLATNMARGAGESYDRLAAVLVEGEPTAHPTEPSAERCGDPHVRDLRPLPQRGRPVHRAGEGGARRGLVEPRARARAGSPATSSGT